MTTRKTAPKPADQTSVFRYLASNFGLTDAVLSIDKTGSLRKAFNQIRVQKITDPTRAAEILAKTPWFRQNGVAITQRLAQESSAPGVFSKTLDAGAAQLKDKFAALGVSTDGVDLRALARQQYIYGLNDSQVVDKLFADYKGTTTGGGTTGDAVKQIDNYAYQLGVNVTDQDRYLWAQDLALGNKTPADYESMLREKSAQTYPVFADQIRSGQNLSDLAGAYRDKAASLLEVDPQDISWTDPLFKDGKAFTTTDPKTGQPVMKNLWQFETDVKADQRWQYTQNAHDQYMNTANAVLKRFGMVA